MSTTSFQSHPNNEDGEERTEEKQAGRLLREREQVSFQPRHVAQLARMIE